MMLQISFFVDVALKLSRFFCRQVTRWVKRRNWVLRGNCKDQTQLHFMSNAPKLPQNSASGASKRLKSRHLLLFVLGKRPPQFASSGQKAPLLEV
jgi:hypothetical protein